MVQIRFWWLGYFPEKALTSFDPVALETPFEHTVDGGKTWKSPRPGTTLQTVHEWLVDHDCQVVDTRLVKQRNNGRWEGLYVLTIGKRR
mgnify:FL=1